MSVVDEKQVKRKTQYESIFGQTGAIFTPSYFKFSVHPTVGASVSIPSFSKCGMRDDSRCRFEKDT